MFMVIKEDIENLVFKCEKLIEANIMKSKRNKKEERTLKRVIETYEVSEDNEIVYTEILNRHSDIVTEQEIIKEENKHLKVVIRKLKSLLNTDNVIEDSEPEDIEPEDNEIGQLE